MPQLITTSKFRNEFVPASITCLSEGYKFKRFAADLFAGVTVGIVALPLAMAFAIAAGLTPDKGLITAVVAGFLISALGGSRVQIGGPTGAFVVIVFNILQKHGYEGLAMATLIAGVILILMGLARLGNAIKYIPHPVIAGFTTGIAVIIFTSQVKDFLGLNIDYLPAEFLVKWYSYFEHLHTLNPSAALVGAASLAILIGLRGRELKIPSTLIVVVGASFVTWAFSLPVDTIGSRFGSIPRMLPAPALPAWSFAQIGVLFPAALTIAFLAAIESLLSAVVADGMSGGRHRSNCELVGQGVANIAVVLFGGMPATGAIARTAANVRSGAETPVAGMIHAVTLLLIMVIAAPLAIYVPLSALAAILFVAAWNMSDPDQFRFLLRAPREDVLVLLTTFFLTLMVDLTVAVEVGIVLAALLFVKRMSDVTNAATELEVFQDESDAALVEDSMNALQRREIPKGVQIFQMKGPFFFAAADRMKDVLQHLDNQSRVFILRMRKVPVIDATGLHQLKELLQKCTRSRTVLLLSGVQPPVEEALRKIGLWEEIGENNFCRNIDHALVKAGEILAERR